MYRPEEKCSTVQEEECVDVPKQECSVQYTQVHECSVQYNSGET